MMQTTRREFSMGTLAFGCCSSLLAQNAKSGGTPLPQGMALNAQSPVLDVWQKETDAVRPPLYLDYLEGRRPAAGESVLERLDAGFAKILSEIDAASVADHPAVWLVYNMGVIVKTPQALFSIDLVHRRALDLAPRLDFALITHNHGDHYQMPFYRAMDRAHKTVISNFADNYGAADWRKKGLWYEAGGYTRAEKTFRIKDVEIRTALVDHNPYLVDFTTTFEIRVGTWRMFHSGDCGNAAKLKTIWGQPDLWVFFPGCGVDAAEAARRIRPAKMAFGHLWELAHDSGRLTTPMVRAAADRVKAAVGLDPVVPLWGERIA